MDIKQAASAYSNIANMGQSMQSSVAQAGGGVESFSDMLSSALDSSVEQGKKAEDLSKLAMMGKGDLTDLATAVSSAEQALDTVVAIRDKVISAYQQIMQMTM